MPNWCNNDITLRHKDPAMIQRAQEALASGTLLQEFFPCPQDLIDTVAGSFGDTEKQAELEAKEQANLKKYGYKNWYDWNVANWGTKWDVGSDGLMQRLDANTLQASFDSAWAPPTEAYAKLCSLGFEVKAYYNEPGMCFCGVWEGNEEDYTDDYVEYSGETSETVREAIGAELDDYFGISEDMAMWEDENAED